jgi:hypothetical protein
MNTPGDDTKRLVDVKIDTLMEKLAALSKQVDTATERLMRDDCARVRRAFQEKEEEGGA